MPDYYTQYPRTILWLVRGGTLRIGGREGDPNPSFEVEIEPFYISKFPITNRQYAAYDPRFVPSSASGRDDDPAIGVSCEEAQGYADWYAAVSRKKMRLPSPVEWEYACRGGSTERCGWCGCVDDWAWHRDNSQGRVPPLNAKPANGFGLFGMLGGVWEWTTSLDRRDPLAVSSNLLPSDPGAPTLRGGSYLTPPQEISCFLSREVPAAEKIPDAGFRIVRSFR